MILSFARQRATLEEFAVRRSRAPVVASRAPVAARALSKCSRRNLFLYVVGPISRFETSCKWPMALQHCGECFLFLPRSAQMSRPCKWRLKNDGMPSALEPIGLVVVIIVVVGRRSSNRSIRNSISNRNTDNDCY